MGLLNSAEDDCLRVVVGTKKDLVKPETREITEEEGRRLSQELNSHLDPGRLSRDPFFETSSLTSENVKEVFEFIFQHCLPLPAEYQKKNAQDSTINLHDSCAQQNKSKCAC